MEKQIILNELDKGHFNIDDKFFKNYNNNFKNLFQEIKKINLRISKNEDDSKNIINEKEDIIQELNNKLYQQEKALLEAKNEISNLYKKIDDIINKFTNELTDKENKINLIDKKITNVKNENIEMNNSNKKLISDINNQINEKEIKINNDIIKEKCQITNEIYSKYDELNKNIKYVNDDLIKRLKEQFKQLLLYPEYIKKINYKFEKNPCDLKYNLDITKENTKYGYNDIFELFISIKDNKEYLVSANSINYNIEVFALDNSIIFPLKGHKNDIRTVRYFINKRDFNFNEYLISADDSKKVIVWDITNGYNIKLEIDTKYSNCIFSCLLVFPFNSYDSFIITSTNDISKNKDKSATKIYSLENGELVRYINNSNNSKIYYLLLWHNKLEDKYYIFQFSSKNIDNYK